MDASSINEGLAFWSVAGPLLTAGASTYWHRRVQVSDRDHDEQRAAQEREHQERLDDARRALGAAEKAFVERRKIFLDFVTASYDFLWHLPGVREESISDANRHREVFSRAYATLMVLDGPAIGDQATELWNAVFQARSLNAGAPPEEKQRVFGNLMTSRERFQIRAQELLAQHYQGMQQIGNQLAG